MICSGVFACQSIRHVSLYILGAGCSGCIVLICCCGVVCMFCVIMSSTVWRSSCAPMFMSRSCRVCALSVGCIGVVCCLIMFPVSISRLM